MTPACQVQVVDCSWYWFGLFTVCVYKLVGILRMCSAVKAVTTLFEGSSSECSGSHIVLYLSETEALMFCWYVLFVSKFVRAKVVLLPNACWCFMSVRLVYTLQTAPWASMQVYWYQNVATTSQTTITESLILVPYCTVWTYSLCSNCATIA